jgi:hypothetical protein
MIEVGRRPVLILWGTIVAERLGFERDEALTLGRAVASLGGRMSYARPEMVTPAKISEMRAKLGPGQTIDVGLIDRVVSIARVPEGLRAVVKNQPIDPASVELYLGEKFGDHIDDVAGAMISLAETLPPSRLAECAFELYEQFRPETSELDIDRISASIRSNPRVDHLSNDDSLNESWWEDAQGEMPSFRGPQALIGGMMPSHRVERMRRERTALAPAGVADAPMPTTRRRALEPPASPRSTPVAVSPAVRPRRSGAIPAHRPTSPVVLILVIFLAGAIGGGVGALLVAPQQRTNVLTELRGLLASYRHTSSPRSPMSEAEPDPSVAYSDSSAGSPEREPIAVEISTPLASAPAIVQSSNTVNGTPGSPPADNDDASEVTRMERDDEAPGKEPIAVEVSTPLAPATAVAPPSNTLNGTLAYAPADNDGAFEVARMELAHEAPRSEPIAVETSPPPAPATAVVPPSSTENGTPASPPVEGHAASELARIAMARGDERMRQGDVVAARRFYEMAAGAGMVQAATALGRTFDPVYLLHARVRGAFADAERAKQWYENAAKAGDMEALARIELLTWDRSHR